MRVVVQRVKRACVSVQSRVVGSIEKGLFLLVGIERDDTEAEIDTLVRKVVNLRVWPASDDGSGSPRTREEWKRSVMDIGAGILVVSQFTLLGSVKKGNKPDFHHAMPPVEARRLFDIFVEKVKLSYPGGLVQTGAFGEYMEIESFNDGPVTLLLEVKPKIPPN